MHPKPCESLKHCCWRHVAFLRNHHPWTAGQLSKCSKIVCLSMLIGKVIHLWRWTRWSNDSSLWNMQPWTHTKFADKNVGGYEQVLEMLYNAGTISTKRRTAIKMKWNCNHLINRSMETAKKNNFFFTVVLRITIFINRQGNCTSSFLSFPLLFLSATVPLRSVSFPSFRRIKKHCSAGISDELRN